MGKRTRNIILSVVIVVIIFAFAMLKNVDKNKDEDKIISGLVKDKIDSEKNHCFVIETFGQNENQLEEMTFIVKDDNMWTNIKVGDYYFLTYKEENKDLVLLNAQKNEVFKKVYKNYIDNEEKKEKNITVEEKEKEKITKKEEQEKHIAIFPSSTKIKTTDLTLLDSTKVDINGNKKEESVELYTTAQRDPSGEIMWDDGQKWFLLVKDDEKEFVLFDEYVQLGVLEFWVFTSKDEYHIVTLQTGSAVYKLSDYTYDKEKGAFIKKDIFNPEFLNVIHGSTIK